MKTNTAYKTVEELTTETNRDSIYNLISNLDWNNQDLHISFLKNENTRADISEEEKARNKARIDLLKSIQDRTLEITACALGLDYAPLNNIPTTARQEQTGSNESNLDKNSSGHTTGNESERIVESDEKTKTETSVASNVKKEVRVISMDSHKKKKDKSAKTPLIDAMTEINKEEKKESEKVSKSTPVIEFERIAVLGSDIESTIAEIKALKEIKDIVVLEANLRGLKKNIDINVLRNLYIELVQSMPTSEKLVDKFKNDVNKIAVRFKGTVETHQERIIVSKPKEPRFTLVKLIEECKKMVDGKNVKAAYEMAEIHLRKKGVLDEEDKVLPQMSEANFNIWFAENLDKAYKPEPKEVSNKTVTKEELTDIKANQDGQYPFKELVTFKEAQENIVKTMETDIAKARELGKNYFVSEFNHGTDAKPIPVKNENYIGFYKNNAKEIGSWSEAAFNVYFNELLRDFQKGTLDTSTIEEESKIIEEGAKIIKKAETEKKSSLEAFRNYFMGLSTNLNSMTIGNLFKKAKKEAENLPIEEVQNPEIFIRATIKEKYPAIWKSVENILTLESLEKAIKHLYKTQGFVIALNTTYDIIETNKVVSTESWTSALIEDWFNKYILPNSKTDTEVKAEEKPKEEVKTTPEKGKSKGELIEDLSKRLASAKNDTEKQELEKQVAQELAEFCEKREIASVQMDGMLGTIRKKAKELQKNNSKKKK